MVLGVVLLGCVAWLAILIWSRACSLDRGFWNDEVYSALNYIDPGPTAIFGDRYLPNNHVLFSWLAWETTSRFGRTEAIYRLWSVVPALLAVVVATAFALLRLGGPVGLVFAFLATTSAVHLDLASQARGYGLAFLAAVAMLIGAVRVSDAPRRPASWALLAAGGWMGIATLPVFVLPFAGQLAAVATRRGRLLGSLTVALLVAAGVQLFYGDLLGHVWRARSQHFGAPVTLGTVFTGPITHLLLADQPATGRRALIEAIAIAIAAPTIVAGVVRLVRRGDLALVANLALPIVATYGALLLLGAFMVPRFVSYLLFHLLLLVACGSVELGQALARRAGARVVGAAAALAAILLSWDFGSRVLQARSTPLEAYKDVAAIVRSLGATHGVTNSLYSAGFDYYLPRFLEYPPPADLGRALCDSPETVVFVEYPMYPNGGDTSCIAGRARTRFVVPQRVGGPDAWMRVWVIEPRLAGGRQADGSGAALP